MTNIFIDGSAGTTGLRIADRLCTRKDISLLTLPDSLRKDPSARKEVLNSADIVFLCLPDDAAREAVSLTENPKVKLIDTSTAHRTDPQWVYGFAELTGQRERIVQSCRIANPGCHASGFIALVAPLIEEKLLPKDVLLSCFSLTGYSGGGKKMIAQYEAPDRPVCLLAPRQYALPQQHKHLKEMLCLCGLENAPVFSPIVGDFYSGMEVTVPLHKSQLRGTAEDIRQLYQHRYSTGLVRFCDCADADGMLSATACANRDDMLLSVYGNADRILLTAVYDNLGKGASGAAIQNMNLLLGCDEAEGLTV